MPQGRSDGNQQRPARLRRQLQQPADEQPSTDPPRAFAISQRDFKPSGGLEPSTPLYEEGRASTARFVRRPVMAGVAGGGLGSSLAPGRRSQGKTIVVLGSSS